MNSPFEPENTNARPDQEATSRQVRLMFASGKSAEEVTDWLRQQGYLDYEIENFLPEEPFKKPKASWAFRFAASTMLICLILVVVVTLIYRPWQVTWISRRTGMPIDPVISVGVYWCGGLLVATFICSFSAFFVGMLIDRIRDMRAQSRARAARRLRRADNSDAVAPPG